MIAGGEIMALNIVPSYSRVVEGTGFQYKP